MSEVLKGEVHGQFLAIHKKTIRNDENDCVISFSTDATQIAEVNQVPCQTLIRIKWDVVPNDIY